MMKRRERPEHERIRELLRRGDPGADGCDPGMEEVRQMRRKVLRAVPSPVLRALQPLPALAVSALVVLLVVLGWNLMRWETTAPVQEPEVVAAPLGPQPQRRTRQIQFATPGGTRVVWILDSDFGV